MAKRLVVVFFPQSRQDDPKPHPVILARCKPSSVDDLVAKCGEKIHRELIHPTGRGKLLLGHESDPCIISKNPDAPGAIPWQGTSKSGQFGDFLKPHAAQFFQSSAIA